MTSANIKLKDSKLFLSKIATETLIAERDYYKNKFKGGRNKDVKNRITRLESVIVSRLNAQKEKTEWSAGSVIPNSFGVVTTI